MEMGCLWNTMIMAVKVKTLWQLGKQYFPEMMRHFEVLRSALLNDSDGERSEAALFDIYAKLTPQNFSRGLLQRAVAQTVVMPMDDVEWDDWGRPERIIDSLARIGRRPTFSPEILNRRGARTTTFANASVLEIERTVASEV